MKKKTQPKRPCSPARRLAAMLNGRKARGIPKNFDPIERRRRARRLAKVRWNKGRVGPQWKTWKGEPVAPVVGPVAPVVQSDAPAAREAA